MTRRLLYRDYRLAKTNLSCVLILKALGEHAIRHVLVTESVQSLNF